MERSTIFNGKTHYFDWAIFNSKLLVYQRVEHIIDMSTMHSSPSGPSYLSQFIAKFFGHLAWLSPYF
jgi:hypothetical protein